MPPSPMPPDQPTRPQECGQCGSADLKPHCGHPRCPWSHCGVCGMITGFVLGRPNTMPSKYPQWHEKGA